MLALAFGLVPLLMHGQELYVHTEPASNMATRSIGVRLHHRLMNMKQEGGYSYRVATEVMYGVNRKLMVHGSLYASNMMRDFGFEGISGYAKYRFLSVDDVHSHFRMAAFGRVSVIDNPVSLTMIERKDLGGGVVEEQRIAMSTDEIDLEGTHSGYAGGIVATQLLHKLALSASAAYLGRWKNWNGPGFGEAARENLHTSFSAGYLLFPRTYRDYRQTNLNLYLELLHGRALGGKGDYLDLAPSIQFIFGSVARLDASYRFQAAGDMRRYSERGYLLRLEYNFFPK